MTCLSEHQEHCCTLSSSPHKAAPTRANPIKNSSLCRENGQFEENNLSSSETDATASANVSLPQILADLKTMEAKD